MAAGRKLGNLAADKTVFFCCDMQEKFRPAIAYFTDIVTCAGRLVKAGKILNIPLIATEQYPKGLGNTVPELDVSHAVGVFPKTKFSMVISEVEEKLKTLCGGDVQHIVLFGIEAHVCVQQTVIDLLERNYDVHVVADACSSRNMIDRVFAYQCDQLRLLQHFVAAMNLKQRFQHSGAIVTTSEAVLLQLIGDKDHPKFKEIQGLIKDKAPDSGLLNKL